MRYAIVIEKSKTGYGAYAPDLPGVGVVGDSVSEVKQLLRDAVAFHVDGLKADGEPIPPPSVQIEYMELPAA